MAKSFPLTDLHLRILRAVADGPRGVIPAGRGVPSACTKLHKLGYLAFHETAPNRGYDIVTDKGREALAAAGADMPDQPTFEDRFRERCKAARHSRGLRQAEVARLLRIRTETYKKYETRSVMPLRHLVPFAHMTRTTIAFLLSLTGCEGV